MQHLLVLIAICISQLLLPPAEADFTFTLHIASHSTGFRCSELLSTCETFFPFFCLRGPSSSRDTSSTRCPLGKNSDVFDHNTQSGTRTISSSQPWQGGFQLYIRALDHDAGVSDPDHIADIFINRDLEANSGTTDLRTYTDDRISLQMTFRVDCQSDFYGPACTTFCQEQDDDTNGHYTCDPADGSHICRQDYYDAPACNTFCQKQDDDVNGHFTCDPEDGSRVCLADYFGRDCLTFCQPEDGVYYCDPGTGARVCEDGFTNPGNFCRENVDDCAAMPCENLGECTDLIDGYSCACAPGYTGRNCSTDIEECLVADCPLNSTCVEEVPGSFTCRCHPGFEGEDCTEIEPCTSDPCQNGGTCISDGPFNFSCVCPVGVTGSRCQFGLCGEKVCSSGQTCIGTEGVFECVVLASDPDTNTGGERNKNVVVIGGVLGGLALIVVLLIVIVLICVCSKRKMVVYKADRSSHIYEITPTHGSKGKFSESPVDEGMADNPLYNQPSPPPSKEKLQYYAHSGSTSSLHIVQNSLYQSAPNGESVVYEQVGPKMLESADRLPNSFVTTNVAYAPGRSEKQECIDNPMYKIMESKGSMEVTTPTYSVPRPVDVPHEGKSGYAPLSNSSTPSLNSASSDNASSSVPQPESGNMTSEAMESTHYAVPTGGVAGGSGLGKEGSMQYSKLKHTDECEKPKRLAMDSDTGYQALQKH